MQRYQDKDVHLYLSVDILTDEHANEDAFVIQPIIQLIQSLNIRTDNLLLLSQPLEIIATASATRINLSIRPISTKIRQSERHNFWLKLVRHSYNRYIRAASEE